MFYETFYLKFLLLECLWLTSHRCIHSCSTFQAAECEYLYLMTVLGNLPSLDILKIGTIFGHGMLCLNLDLPYGAHAGSCYRCLSNTQRSEDKLLKRL